MILIINAFNILLRLLLTKINEDNVSGNYPNKIR
jgi:hypothetical protein